ncbi:MAG: MMPL family transporter [Colwellia sp.]
MTYQTKQYDYQFSAFERAVFVLRPVIILLSILLTVFFAYRATFVQPDTRLERLIPGSHEFVVNAKEFRANDSGSDASFVRIAVVNRAGDSVFDYDYLLSLQKISDELSLLDGVDTAGLNSLWSPGMLWFGITPQGLDSGPVIDNSTFANNQAVMDQIHMNAMRAGIVGSYVSNDFHSTMIDFQVMALNPKTRQPMDYNEFAKQLEEVRTKYQDDKISIHIIGELKKISDLVEGFEQIALFFITAILITSILLFNYSRCWRATLIPVICSLIAVIWQLGVLNLLGYNLGVFSVLVPFLVFAIAVSHGVQMINAIAHESAKGCTPLEASKITFHLLHKAGLLALLSDGIGFAMLFVIDIGAIKDLAMVASVGVALVIFTNLILLPMVMSYAGVSKRCITHAQSKLDAKNALWEYISLFATERFAKKALVALVLLSGVGLYWGLDTTIGDLDKGAPELRPDSRYNLDNSYITSNFSTSTDLMTIFIGTDAGQCETYKVIELVDQLGWILQNTAGVQSVYSAATLAKANRYLGNEGNLKMMALPRDERILARAIAKTGLVNTEEGGNCDKQTIDLELVDHRQETLGHIVQVVRDFAAAHDEANLRFRLGEGNAAYEAATNEVIDKTQYQILAYIYGIVAFMCLLMFRSVRATICILIPLALTSLLCQALMTWVGIGVKVATLPVIALGVGIGVDYGIYIYSRLLSYLALGHPLRIAYLETLKTTGKAVVFTGVTLAVGVATWIISPIQFQADMGILLTFMFLWNMIGAVTLIPALAYFLLPKQSEEPSDIKNVDELESAAVIA